jgi:hypothetical protein
VGRLLIRLAAVSFAYRDVDRMAEFWRALVPDAPLAFRAAPKTPTIEAPLHLCVNTPDPDAEVERALGLGARLVVRKHEQAGPIEPGVDRAPRPGTERLLRPGA